MEMYNPKEASAKESPEQQIIAASRRVEYDRQFKTAAEDKLNQENPTPENVFKVQAQGIARKIVEGANTLVNKKGKGEISNADFASDMAMVDQMVDNLGNFTTNIEKNLAVYKEMLMEGTLSYGMDQHDEAVLQAIDKGEVKLALDKEGRVKMEGKGNHAIKGLFDVNIYDFYNIPQAVKKLPPINNLLKPFINKLGVDENGMPITRVDKFGNMIYDTGDLSEHDADILDFTENAVVEAGPEGIRSYLGDHLNMPSQEVKALSENVNYTDENGNNWANQAEAVAAASMKDFAGAQYKRQTRAHPDTIANNASKSATQIATQKQVPLINPDPKAQEEVQMQQTEVMQTPQGEIAETTTEDAIGPISASLGQPAEAPVEEQVSEDIVEKTPLKMKALSASDLIKKYS